MRYSLTMIVQLVTILLLSGCDGVKEDRAEKQEETQEHFKFDDNLSKDSTKNQEAVQDHLNSDDNQSKEEKAINMIASYAQNSLNPIPTLEDYKNAGIKEVNSENIDSVNEAIDGVNIVSFDELHEFINNLLKKEPTTPTISKPQTNGILLYALDSTKSKTNTEPTQFIDKFPATLDTLKANGINTIFFVTNRQFYHFTKSGDALKDPKYYYIENRGYSAKYFQTLAKIAREKGMKIVVYYNIVHTRANVIARALPELLFPGVKWNADSNYKYAMWDYQYEGYLSGYSVEHNGRTYRLKKGTTSKGHEPGSDDNDDWVVTTRALPDPNNPEIYTQFGKMFDELIDLFTVDGVKPDGFHMGGDEAMGWNHLECDENNGCSYAKLYANFVNKLYGHIHDKNPDMNVYIWGDMLGEYHNGNLAKTKDAINLVDKDIIIADWKYNPDIKRGYDRRSMLFKSIKQFTDSGHRVLSCGWNKPDVAKSLVWSGKIADMNKEEEEKKYLGNLSTMWYTDTILDIVATLKDPTHSSETKVTDTVSSIKSVFNNINSNECSQIGEWSGTYPNCVDCNTKDGIYYSEYRNYSKSSSGLECKYEVITLPTPIGSWDFSSQSDLTLKEGATIEQGVLKLSETNDYTEANDIFDEENKIENMTVSFSFKLNSYPTDEQHQVLVGKHYREFEIGVLPRGGIYIYKSNADADIGYEGLLFHTNEYKDFKPNQWYHLVWSMKGKNHNLYIGKEVYHPSSPSKYAGIVNHGNKLNFGKRVNDFNPKYNYDGEIDSVKIFDSDVSEEQAHRLMDQMNK